MGLFSKKKEKKAEVSFSNEFYKPKMAKLMPNLPELPRYEGKEERFPEYESELNSIKEQVGRSRLPENTEQIDIPIRKPSVVQFSASGLPNISQGINPQAFQPKQMQSRPMQQSQRQGMPGLGGNKPIFVRIEKYREALHSLEGIKELCKNAEVLLSEINRLREEENRELEKWKGDINRIKDRLVLVDKTLFEG